MRSTLRDMGFSIGSLPAGAKNSITDVPEVKVGHVTIKQQLTNSEAVTTGVTAILPHADNLFNEKVSASYFVLNGFGKTTGLVQVEELGVIESPIMLTNTFSVPAVTEGTIQYMLERNKEIGEEAGTVNIVVGECNDSYLNSIRSLFIRPKQAVEAIEKATDNKVEEGAVGAGTGMTCFGWKGGIGSSSRIVGLGKTTFTVGALVLTNFGLPEELTILGQKIGKEIQPEINQKPDDGSIIIVIGTDAPMDSRQLKRLAKRAALGLARTGSIAHHGSGDIVIAFSNGYRVGLNNSEDIVTFPLIREDSKIMSKFFQAVVESVEEAILNSLFMAETTVGRLNRSRNSLPIDKVVNLLRKYD